MHPWGVGDSRHLPPGTAVLPGLGVRSLLLPQSKEPQILDQVGSDPVRAPLMKCLDF